MDNPEGSVEIRSEQVPIQSQAQITKIRFKKGFMQISLISKYHPTFPWLDIESLALQEHILEMADLTHIPIQGSAKRYVKLIQ